MRSALTGTGAPAPPRYEGFGTMPLAGRWRPGRSGKVAKDTDPWNGQTLTEIPMADAADLDEALTAAQRAQREWAAQSPARRAEIMLAAAAVLEARKAEITDWLIRETGGTTAKAELEWSLGTSRCSCPTGPWPPRSPRGTRWSSSRRATRP